MTASPDLASDKDILDAMNRASAHHKGAELRDCLSERLDVPRGRDADFDHPQSAILHKKDIVLCLSAAGVKP